MELSEIKHIKEIAMETSNFIEKLLTISPPFKEADEVDLKLIETFRLLKGIVDSVILRKDLSTVEDVLVGLCFLLVQRPSNVDKIRRSLKVIIATEILLKVIEKGDSDGLQQETDTKGT